MLKSFFLALGFLTALPVPRGTAASSEGLRRTLAYFPLVGAVQGLILVAVDLALSTILPVSIVSALIIAVLALTNYGLHLDGFADTIDGLAGGKTKEERLRIMRGGGIGPSAITALVILLLVKFLCVYSLPDDMRLAVIFLFPIAGRFAIVPLACRAPYAREGEGLGKAFAGNTQNSLLISIALFLALAIPFAGLAAFIVLLPIMFMALVSTAFFKSRLGGVTGDIFGFQSELGEAVALLIMIIYNTVTG
jgi:adenosylcobinamide-GDP ribazoletransferase